jgi:signal transduction histidine kinase/DNA-binding response OmpR family regulator
MATILVIDDEPPNRLLLLQLLGYAGHRMLEAGSAREGLDIVRAERPDLVIVDIQMPDMDGYDFVREVRSEREIRDSLVMFYTGAYEPRRAQPLAEALGVRFVLTKPIEPEQLVDFVEAALGKEATPGTPALPSDFDRAHLRLVADKLTDKVAEVHSLSERLTKLIGLSLELAVDHDLPRLHELFGRAGCELLDTTYTAIGIVKSDVVTIDCFVVHAVDCVASSQPHPLAGLLQRLSSASDSICLHDLDVEPLSLGLPRQCGRIRDFLGVPVASRKRRYGWIYFAQKNGDQGFTVDDRQIGQALAAQLAMAYERAFLFHEIRHHAELLETRVSDRTAELKRSNEELEQFAYVASHDLQEPLRMVSSYTQLLARRYKGRLDADADEFIDYAVDGATRMQALISDLLVFSRLNGSAVVSYVSTDSALDEALARLTAAIDDGAAVITRTPLPTVRADRGQFVQLFQNLIGNAIKFRGDAEAAIHVTASAAGGEWLFSVRDNGIGIEPRYAERIFAIFKRLHGRAAYPGTGIGLAICKRIVTRMGGRIWVDSRPGEGATFCFTVPASNIHEAA